MENDIVSANERLARLSPDRWQSKLALCFIAVAIVLAMMLEPRKARASDMPPFTISDPMCNTGFTVAMRFDERNAAGTIIKSVWVRKCVKVPKIIYGGKV